MLSDEWFVKFAKDQLVLSWENVREPVNIVHEGKRTTLGGNTVMYMVSPDGTVADAFPGVYRADDVLPSFKVAAKIALQSHEEQSSYHRQRGSRAIRVRINSSKMAVESPILDAEGVGGRFEISTDQGVIDLSHVARSREETRSLLGIPKELSDEDALTFAIKLDSETNMSTLRPVVHDFLARARWTPQQLKPVMFKDFLGIDVDDPNLGIR